MKGTRTVSEKGLTGAPLGRSWAFGDFLLDERERRLTRQGAPVGLAPKAFDLLVFLVERRGQLVATSELLEGLWPDTFVGDGTLTRHVSSLRKALGERAGVRFIETVRKSGYRFLGEVREVGSAAPRANAARPVAPPLKILVADDHTLFREGLRHVLGRLGDDVQVVEAGDGAEALRAAESHPDLGLVLLDLVLPGRDGFAALETFAREYPALPIVVLSGSESRGDMQRALDRGAMGFIPKSATAPVMLGALRLVLAGGVYVPPALLPTAVSRDEG